MGPGLGWLVAGCVATIAPSLGVQQTQAPVVPPADWEPRIASGDMVWTADLPTPWGGITPGFYPVVGNVSGVRWFGPVRVVSA
jgi:hypothetical protein